MIDSIILRERDCGYITKHWRRKEPQFEPMGPSVSLITTEQPLSIASGETVRLSIG